MMIILTEEQVQQIEEALECAIGIASDHNRIWLGGEKALAIIRAARAQEQAEQEPVAWAYIDADGSFMDALDRQHGAYQTPLYAAPVRTKDLTDDEIIDLVRDECVDMRWPSTPLFIARAVIAADRKLNK